MCNSPLAAGFQPRETFLQSQIAQVQVTAIPFAQVGLVLKAFVDVLVERGLAISSILAMAS